MGYVLCVGGGVSVEYVGGVEYAGCVVCGVCGV